MKRLVFSVFCLLPASAFAQTYETVAPGVQIASFVDEGSEVDIAKIDLCAPGVRMRATAPGEGPRTTQSFGELVGASVAVNGDWWSNDGEEHLPETYPRGLGVGDGHHFEGTVDRPSYGVVAFGNGRALHSIMEEDLGGPNLFWMQDVVSGQPTLVWDGATRDNPNAHCGVRRARTATGFDAAMTTMYLAVVQEAGVSTGKTCNELADFMLRMGAYSALNQDGGGSSSFFVAGRGLLNDPSDGAPRSLVNHWGVRATGWGPPRSCATRQVPVAAEGAVRRRIASGDVMAAWGFEPGEVSIMGAEEIAAYAEASDWPAAPRFVHGDGPEVWLVDGTTKRHVTNPNSLASWRGMTIVEGAQAEIDGLVTGPPVIQDPVLVLGGDLTVWMLDVAADGGGGGGGGGGVDGGGGGGAGGGDAGGGGGGGGVGGGGCAAGGRGAASGWMVIALAALLARRRATA